VIRGVGRSEGRGEEKKEKEKMVWCIIM